MSGEFKGTTQSGSNNGDANDVTNVASKPDKAESPRRTDDPERMEMCPGISICSWRAGVWNAAQKTLSMSHFP